MTFTIPSFHLSSIGPWLTLTVTAILILVLDALSPKGRKVCFSWLALAGLVVAAFQTIGLWGSTGTDFARMVYLDNFAFFFYLIFILGAALTVLISRQYLEDYGKNMGEYYALILFATLGMMLMAAGSHLIMIFLGLEIMSIAVYVLAGLFREDLRSNEAALKYHILGSFSSAFLLFGMAMLYGASGGTLFLDDLPLRLGADPAMAPLVLLGVGLLIVGFGFKVAAAP
ncbi:MAG: proton-conducting transporter membrane subunit, partial [Deltaproteobacteria bacterium]|nr:proton-conducting transporter membrane subunit [Deltaproteobacteria bacterium]